MPTDLTFQQLSDALPTDSIQVSDGAAALPAGVYINASNLTGDSLTALTNEKVVETAIKLLKGCRDAQTTANDGVDAGSRLNAFPNPTFGVTTTNNQGNAQQIATYSVQGTIVTSFDEVTGPQI